MAVGRDKELWAGSEELYVFLTGCRYYIRHKPCAQSRKRISIPDSRELC